MAVILGLPIVISYTATAIEGLDNRLRLTLQTLGASGAKLAVTSLWEGRFQILVAALTSYGRIIGEVGSAMMLGGNIKWHTRTITTAITLETGKGDFALGIALGSFCLQYLRLEHFTLLIRRRVETRNAHYIITEVITLMRKIRSALIDPYIAFPSPHLQNDQTFCTIGPVDAECPLLAETYKAKTGTDFVIEKEGTGATLNKAKTGNFDMVVVRKSP